MSRSRNYCFTINNPEEVIGVPKVPTWNPEKMSYLGYSLERGEDGVRHWQGYVELLESVKLTTVKKYLECDWAHLEARKGTAKQARDYCFKHDKTYEGTCDEHGTLSQQGKRTDLNEAVLKIKNKEWTKVQDILEENPTLYYQYGRVLEKALKIYAKKRENKAPEVLLWIGETGTGKSKKAYEDYPELYNKPKTNEWWEGYEGEETVLFDDFRGEIEVGEMLSILDRYPYTCNVKGSSTQLRATRFIITTNDDPRTWAKWQGTTDETWSAWDRRITNTRHFDKKWIRTGQQS